MVGELFDLFFALPILGKVGILVGLMASLSTLHTYINPAPKSKLKPIKTVDLDGGQKLKVYKQEIEGEDKLFYNIS